MTGSSLGGILGQLHLSPDTWILMAGDFNCVLNAELDRNPSCLGSKPKTPAALRMLQEGLGLIDLWRSRNPTDRAYSCYSPAANPYSHLDYVFTQASKAHNISGAQYLGTYLSDHSPLLVTYSHHAPLPPIPLRHLYVPALKDPVFRDQIEHGLIKYFRDNWGSIEERTLEWDAMKIVVRGICISVSKGIRHDMEKELTLQESKLADFEISLLTGSMEKLELNTQRQKVGELWDRLDKHNPSVGWGQWNQKGNKSGCLLTRIIRTEHQPQPILEMQVEQGKLVHTQQAINKIFAAHLQRVYTDDQGVGADQGLHNYMQMVPLLRLTPEARAPLGALIHRSKLLEAIGALKSPGLDGFPAEFYHNFSEICGR
ncbi:hypothetical protein NDU88_001345 [Pleurodeles waltl]|uniref:Endonuclease/exonuclease/phosphatase domain-containing protein n=1 Tax=Pleurodeles waltl TaxID=8319 RepID=A0AAV7NFG5_PLEWA|nr:hypothetical protein NDU88_001345 [Pleurodeles waltl]